MTIPDINIFIDTSEMFTDPFFKNNFNRLLLKFSDRYGIPIYMSRVVYDESRNNFSKNVRQRIIELERALDNFNPYYPQNSTPENIKKSYEEFMCYYDSFYEDLIQRNIIEILDYEENLLSELVHRSIHRIKPFTEKKQEFRDAITWMTYAKKANENCMEHCYFITNNVNDFMNTEKTAIHPDLLKDTDRIKLVTSSRRFFEDDLIAQYTRSVELYGWIMENPLDESKLLQLIHKQFEDIESYTSTLVHDNNSSVIDEDDAIGDLAGIDIKNIDHFEVEVIEDEIIVQGYINIEVSIEVSLYNMFRDKGDDIYMHVGSDTAKLSYNFALSYNKDDDTIENFEIIDWDVLASACVTRDWYE